MRDGPRKLGKNDSRKSKLIDLDGLKDKAISIKDSKRDKIHGMGKSFSSTRREIPTRLGKPRQKESSLSFDGLIPGFIDKKIVLAVLGVILICVLGVLFAGSFTPSSNVTNNTTSENATVPANHFNNGLISFDYPAGWNVTNGTKPPVVVTVSKDENNSFVVMNSDLKEVSFSDRVFEWKMNILQSGELSYEGNITIDNSTGYNIEATYMSNSSTYNVRGVAVSKGDTVYFIMFVFNKSLLDYKEDMNMVINSFHII